MRLPPPLLGEHTDEVLTNRLGLNNKAIADHVNQARDFLAKSREYLNQGDLHQASEKGWGAAALMVKAVAIARGWEYERHSDFSQVLNSAYLATGEDQIRLLRGIPNELHGNFYQRKRFLHADDIGDSLAEVATLLDILEPLTEH